LLKDRFDLCYESVASNNHYVVPQLLPTDAPEFDFNRSNNLIFRVQYDFMPYGIIPRLIVRLSAEIDQQRGKAMNWQTGLIIKRDNVSALIEEVVVNDGLKAIDIRVSGDSVERKEYLSLIRREVDFTHKLYKNILYDAMIPCDHCFHKGINTPNYIPYKQLCKFISFGIQENTCGECLEKYSPKELIFGIFTENDLTSRRGNNSAYLKEESISASKVNGGINLHVNGDVNVNGDVKFDKTGQVFMGPVGNIENNIDTPENS